MEFSKQFLRAFHFTVAAEGYVADLKGDKGGKTVYGIASRWWPEVVKKMLGQTPQDALETAKEHYYRNYWFKSGADKLAWPGYLVMFDAAVQHDNGTARNLWKKAGGDWLKAINERAAYYESLAAKNPQFINGWRNRIASLRDEARKPE